MGLRDEAVNPTRFDISIKKKLSSHKNGFSCFYLLHDGNTRHTYNIYLSRRYDIHITFNGIPSIAHKVLKHIGICFTIEYYDHKDV